MRGSIAGPGAVGFRPLGGQWYMAHVYVNGATSAQVCMARYLVHSGFSLNAILTAAGGQAVRLTPATAQEIQAYRGQKPPAWPDDDIAVYPNGEPTSSSPSDGSHGTFGAGAGFKAERLGHGRVRLLLSAGTSSWEVYSLRGARLAGGTVRDRRIEVVTDVPPGAYQAMAATPGGKLALRFTSDR